MTTPSRLCCEPERRHISSLEGLTSATFAKNGTLIPLAQIATLRTGFDFSRIRRKNQERTIIVSGRSAALTAGDLLQFHPARPAGIGLVRRISHRHWRRDPKERGDQRQARRGHSGRPRGDGDRNHPAIQFVPSHAADLHDHTSDTRRHSLWPVGNRASRCRSSARSASSVLRASSSTMPSCLSIRSISNDRTLALREAIVAASQKRLRPILLTSATTVLGLAPMAIAGGALWQPMAVLMMSGLAVASLLTLLFVPAGYFLLFRSDKASAGV